MKPKRIVQIAFSPCFSTARTASCLSDRLTEKLSIEKLVIPFNTPKDRAEAKLFEKDDLVVIAAPTYAGKLPNKLLPDFKTKLKANGSNAVAIVSYGNRAYDNSLAELTAIEKDNGFNIIAAAAFVNEHSMAHMAFRRPDAEDMAEIRDFADRIAEKLLCGEPSAVDVPGDAATPYYVPRMENGEPANFLKAKPLTDMNKCTLCGACANFCPMGSIDKESPDKVTGVCIKCHACVNRCTKNAKYFDDEQLSSHIKFLAEHHSKRNKNECFI